MNRNRLQRLKSLLYNQLPFVGGSLRQMAARSLVEWGSPAALETLAESLPTQPDPQVKQIVIKALSTIKNQPAIDRVIKVWFNTRDQTLADLALQRGWVAEKPALARAFSALKTGQVSLVTNGRGELAEPTLALCHDRDPEVADRALHCLENLRGRYIIRATCALWAENRDPILATALLKAGYTPQSPDHVRILTRLKTGQTQGLELENVTSVGVLVRACADQDPELAARASDVLSRLKDPAAQQEACRMVFQYDYPGLSQAVAAGGFKPINETDQALFFFLTSQWAPFEDIDFDHSRLRAVYETGGSDLRERISRKVRESGRADYLHIIAGQDFQGRIERMTPAEMSTFVQILTEQKNWQRLWELVFRLPLPWSIHGMLALKESGWQPKESEDYFIFQQLASLATHDTLQACTNLASYIPPAVFRSRAHLSQGRINAVAFSPDKPSIVMGTSRRRIASWEYQQAQVISVTGDFNHSISKVAFTGSGSLILGERPASTDTTCAVYSLVGHQTIRLIQGRGPVTAVVNAGDDAALVAFRDSTVALVDSQGRTKPVVRRFGFWARAACAAPNDKTVALLHHGVILLQLPLLDVTYQSARWDHVANAACFEPDSNRLAVGKYNGDIILMDSTRYKTNHAPLLKHKGWIEGLKILHRHPLLISAGAEGSILFTDLRSQNTLWALGSIGDQITSLQTSNDEAFMAVGHADGTVSLWDLRTLDLPLLFENPFDLASPTQLAALRAVLEDSQIELPSAARQTIQYANIALKYRFRFDIEIDTLPGIKLGAYEIDIE